MKTDSEFPLCKELGLFLHIDNCTYGHGQDNYEVAYIAAADLERILEQGQLIEFRKVDTEDFLVDLSSGGPRTHTGLLLNIKPIAKPERRRELSESEVRKILKRHVPVKADIELFVNLLFASADEAKCEHKNSHISEPHLAGARECNDCGAYKPSGSAPYGPKRGGGI